MGREERKLRKYFEERAKRERRLARKYSQTKQFSNDDQAGCEALVASVGPGCCEIEVAGQGRCLCRCSLDIAPGDRVVFAADRRKIVRVLPRRTVLSRPDPHNSRIERLIAANIDVVVVVVSVKSPPLRPGLIDRYLIAIERSGAGPLICVNKVDLSSECPDVEVYRQIGIPVLRCSATTGEGLEELVNALAGKMCVLAGHSGVGKSSLLNALAPGLGLATSTVSDAHNKGRHTTTAASLHRLANGAVIIDTPGIREFGLWQVTADELGNYFPEIRILASRCNFRDCRHTQEPSCAVKDGVESGEIASHRYAAYLRILECVSRESPIY